MSINCGKKAKKNRIILGFKRLVTNPWKKAFFKSSLFFFPWLTASISLDFILLIPIYTRYIAPKNFIRLKAVTEFFSNKESPKAAKKVWTISPEQIPKAEYLPDLILLDIACPSINIVSLPGIKAKIILEVKNIS